MSRKRSVLLASVAVVVLLSPHLLADRTPGAPTQRAVSLLAQAHAARGGAARLLRVKGLELRTKSEITTVLFPDVYRIEMSASFGRIVTCFNGKELWQLWPSGSGMPAPRGADPKRARRGAEGTLSMYSLLYLTRANPPTKLAPAAEGKRTFGPLSGETLRFDSSQRVGVWWLILGDDRLPLALVSRTSTSPEDSAKGYLVLQMSDYREIEGIKFPFRQDAYRLDDQFRITQTLPARSLVGLSVNPRISKAELTRR